MHVARDISAGYLFWNVHPSLQYCFCCLIHAFLYGYFFFDMFILLYDSVSHNVSLNWGGGGGGLLRDGLNWNILLENQNENSICVVDLWTHENTSTSWASNYFV